MKRRFTKYPSSSIMAMSFSYNIKVFDDPNYKHLVDTYITDNYEKADNYMADRVAEGYYVLVKYYDGSVDKLTPDDYDMCKIKWGPEYAVGYAVRPYFGKF